LNVLIVDDHAGMRALIRDMLAPFALGVRECATGEEALALCSQQAPDCVTMDLRMPGMDGLTCVQQLRAQFPSTNIAVVTQFDHDTLRARAQWAGADTYITKDNLDSLRRYIELLADTLRE
jgi:CheY-like chemotaxis protein